MKTGLVILTIFLFPFVGLTQDFTDPALQSLVDAERAFALYAKEKNTRDAFLLFLADDAVTSAPGQGPGIGKKQLENQKPNETYLKWWPVYSDIASSGDFGFNTGPWEFRPNRTDEKAVAFGEFVSIWKKNARGEWKVAIDIGISHGEPKQHTALKTSSMRLRSGANNPAGKTEIFEIEKKFLSDFEQNGNRSYDKLLSGEARFYRAGNLPYTSPDEIKTLLSTPDNKAVYTFMDGDVASSGDLAYVYGKVSSEIIKDGAPQVRQASYMRFWKKEDGRSWKIVLDLISN
jgi:ketosteroid isomerase-like protein